MLQNLIRPNGTQVQRNYKYKRLHVSESDDDIANEQNETLELSNRQKTTGRPDKPLLLEYDTLFERPIQKGESLLSISLKYRISVSDLKRVNKLYKETEFYALNSLKIPVKNNSVLHEMLQEESSEINDQTCDSAGRAGHRQSQSNELETGSDNMPVGVISIDQIFRERETHREARHFLENMKKDLQKLQQKTQTHKGSLDEAATSLTNISFIPLEKQYFNCSGADWDLSWWRVLTIGGIIIVGVPCIYLLVSS